MKTFKIQINEAQRQILVAALKRYPKTEELETTLLNDLIQLPEDQECIGDKVIAFCE